MFNTLTAKLFNWNFTHLKLWIAYLKFCLADAQLEVVSRYRDPQPQVGENYSYLFNLIANICTF